MEDPGLVRFGPPVHQVGGSLFSLDLNKLFGFLPKRVYWISDVPAELERGFHAHRSLTQVLICLSGSVEVTVSTPLQSWSFTLGQGEEALFVPPGLWREVRNFTPGAVLLVLASDIYDADDYLREWESYVDWFDKR